MDNFIDQLSYPQPAARRTQGNYSKPIDSRPSNTSAHMEDKYLQIYQEPDEDSQRQHSPQFGQGEQGSERIGARPSWNNPFNQESDFISENPFQMSGATHNIRQSSPYSYKDSFAESSAQNFVMTDQQPAFDENYNLTLKIMYVTQPGESIAVLGSIQELGNWSDQNRCKMKWTEGHVWQCEKPIKTSKQYFNYKYVLMQNGSMKQWEQGNDRTADLRLLSRIEQSSDVVIEDEWQSFKIRFMVNYNQTHAKQVKVVFKQSEFESKKLAKSYEHNDWMSTKFEQGKINPWVCEMKLPTKKKGYEDIEYHYQAGSISERNPLRLLRVENPDKYRGQLGMQGHPLQINSNNVFVINGIVEKADSNFMGPFEVNEFEKIYFGSYISNQGDVDMLQKGDVKAVLNIMSDDELQERGLNQDKLRKFCQSRGIQQFISSPITDVLSELEYTEQLFQGVRYLHDLINQKGLNVFINSTSGICRSPTLVACFLCLTLKTKDWERPDTVIQNIKQQNPYSLPNSRAIKQTIQTFQQFQKSQLDQLQNQIDSNKKAKDEQQKIAYLQNAQREAEKLRLSRKQAQEQAQKLLEEQQAALKNQQEIERLQELQAKEEQELERLKQKKLQEDEEMRRFKFQQEEIERQNIIQQRQKEESLNVQLQEEEAERQVRKRHLQLQEQEKRNREEKQSQMRQFQENEDMVRRQNEEQSRLLQTEQKLMDTKNQKLMDMQREEEEILRKQDIERQKLAQLRIAEKIQKQEMIMKENENSRQYLVQQLDPDEEDPISIIQQSPPSGMNLDQISENRLPPMAFGDPDLKGMTEQEVDGICDDTFRDTPIEFQVRPNNTLDLRIKAIIDQLKITIPIQAIKAKLYLIGINKCTCDLKGPNVMIKTGGGYQMFNEYVAENHRFFQRKLVVQMIKTDKDLDDIVKEIIEGKKLKGPTLIENPGPASYQKVTESPSRQRFATTTKKVQIELNAVRRDRDTSKESRISQQSPTRTRISFRDSIQPQSMHTRKQSQQSDSQHGSPMRTRKVNLEEVKSRVYDTQNSSRSPHRLKFKVNTSPQRMQSPGGTRLNPTIFSRFNRSNQQSPRSAATAQAQPYTPSRTQISPVRLQHATSGIGKGTGGQSRIQPFNQNKY